MRNCCRKRRHVYAVTMRIITVQGWVVGLGSEPHLFQDQTNLVQEAVSDGKRN